MEGEEKTADSYLDKERIFCTIKDIGSDTDDDMRYTEGVSWYSWFLSRDLYDVIFVIWRVKVKLRSRWSFKKSDYDKVTQVRKELNHSQILMIMIEREETDTGDRDKKWRDRIRSWYSHHFRKIASNTIRYIIQYMTVHRQLIRIPIRRSEWF